MYSVNYTVDQLLNCQLKKQNKNNQTHMKTNTDLKNTVPLEYSSTFQLK